MIAAVQESQNQKQEQSIPIMNEALKMISTTENFTFQKINWEKKLSLKSLSCQSGYKKHIKSFIKVMGTSEYFCQEDIEEYLMKIQREDNGREEAERQSKSTKM